MKNIAQLVIAILPQRLKKAVYRKLFKYEIADDAFIGYSLVMPKKMTIKSGARIGHLTVIKGIEELIVGENGRLGNLNWVTGFPKNDSRSFADQTGRYPALSIGDNASITHRHLIDCTDRITVGAFTTVAGWGSQLMTHSIDIEECRQRSAPIDIGDYCFIGGRTVILKGSGIASNVIVAAGAVVGGKLDQSYGLYGGVPAKFIKNVSAAAKYYSRKRGGVV